MVYYINRDLIAQNDIDAEYEAIKKEIDSRHRSIFIESHIVTPVAMNYLFSRLMLEGYDLSKISFASTLFPNHMNIQRWYDNFMTYQYDKKYRKAVDDTIKEFAEPVETKWHDAIVMRHPYLRIPVVFLVMLKPYLEWVALSVVFALVMIVGFILLTVIIHMLDAVPLLTPFLMGDPLELTLSNHVGIIGLLILCIGLIILASTGITYLLIRTVQKIILAYENADSQVINRKNKKDE